MKKKKFDLETRETGELMKQPVSTSLREPISRLWLGYIPTVKWNWLMCSLS